ncbi:MAG: polymerase subunit chi [Variibacter sp.]|jgi:DNA polymerase-3 subunit chi|nr:polymerase subunit chi [Variibacter sp.]
MLLWLSTTSAESEGVPEVFFYQLQTRSLEAALPPLLEKSLERGWRVVVQTDSAERIEALDGHLWTYRDDSFLPHGVANARDAADQPILLTSGPDNANSANVRFVIHGADLPADIDAYERVVLMFDGTDEDAVAAARLRWKDIKEKGFETSYLQQSPEGRWERKT